MWFSLAAAQGDKDALFKRNRLHKRLQPEQIALAREQGRKIGPVLLPGEADTVAATEQPLTRSPDTNAESASGTSEPGLASRVAAFGAPSSRAFVTEVQSRLAALGFDVGKVDGLIGKRTRRAVREFQKDASMAVTGRLSADLLRALMEAEAETVSNRQAPEPKGAVAKPTIVNEPPAQRTPLPPEPTAIPGSGPELVRAIQAALVRRDFDPGPIDGQIGRRTIEAAKAFQRSAGLRANGSLTPNLLRAILASEATLDVAVARAPVKPNTATPPVSAPPSTPPVAIRTNGASTRMPSATLAPSECSGAGLVRAIQIELKRLGYFDSDVDGISGPRTAAGVRAFEEAKGFAAKGQLTPAVLLSMRMTRDRSNGSASTKPSVASGESIRGEPTQARSSVATTRQDVRPEVVALSAETRQLVLEASPRHLQGAELVKMVQLGLGELGYEPGMPDGAVGSRTVTAAKKFQRDRGLRANGIIGSALLRSLQDALRKGWFSRDFIREAQTLLAQRGYAPGTPDGFLGEQTVVAIKAFQRAEGMEPDGQLSRGLLSAMQ
jgi:peptidoglycan hydrolase-like protein with peptidoglycan-binding domain